MSLSKNLDKQNILWHAQKTKVIFDGIHSCVQFENVTLLDVKFFSTK